MGRAMAQVFAAEGASIAAVDLKAETAEETGTEGAKREYQGYWNRGRRIRRFLCK